VGLTKEIGRRSLEGKSSSLKSVLAEAGLKNHTCKITCKKPGLGVLTRTEAVPDSL
jgi:hypothetical protein